MTFILAFTPLVNFPLIAAQNASLTTAQNSAAVLVTPIITSDGTPVTPSSLTVVTQPTNGSAAVVGIALAYTPTPGFHGIDSFTFKGTVSGTDSNVATATASVYAAAADDLGRVTRSFVSGYTASRAETHRVRRFSKRTVTANFNGALAKGRTITHVRWDCTSPWSIFMENARIIAGQRQVAVDVSYNFAGWGGLLATVTLDNGELFNQEFFYTVLDRPLYPGAVYDLANGPYVLTADV